MKKQEIVSVCLATYNRSHILARTIGNVLNQHYLEFELLIVDDGSDDSTESIVKQFQRRDKRIYYLKHHTNKGLAAARNTAIAHAHGKYFTFIDDDDAWHKDFLSQFVLTAAAYDDNWCFCCGTDYTNSFGTHIHYIPDMKGPLKEYIKGGYTPPVAAQFYYVSTIKKIGGYTPEIQSGVDHDLWLKLAFHNINIYGVPKAMVHPNTVVDSSRMTISKDRWNKIQQSLIIWKKNIIKHFGRSFFYHFGKCYYFGRQKKQFINFLKQKKINQKIIMNLFFAFLKMPFKMQFLKETFFKLKLWLTGKKKRLIITKTLPSFPRFI